MARDAPLAFSLSIALGVTIWLAPEASLLVAVATVVLLASSLGMRVGLIAILLFSTSAYRSRAAMVDADALYTQAKVAFRPPSRCEGTGVVVSQQLERSTDLGRGSVRALEAGSEAPSFSALVETLSLSCGSDSKSRLTAVLSGRMPELWRGDTIRFVADLSPVHLFANEGSLDTRVRLARTHAVVSGGTQDVLLMRRGVGLAAFIDAFRAHVRRRIESTFQEETAPVARALVLGETDLDPGDDEAFKKSGLSHLLAVSGTHLILVGAAITRALHALFKRIEPIAAHWDTGQHAAAVAIPCIWVYADFAGGSGSCVRAAAMLSVGLLARISGRRAEHTRTFSLSALLLLVFDPLLITDLSFALSLGATSGLIAIGPLFRLDAWLPRGPLRRLAEPATTTVSAMLGCAPVLSLISSSIPLFGVVANVLAAPVGELAALPICLIHALASPIPALERITADAGSGALLVVLGIAKRAAHWSHLSVPRPTSLELAVLLIGVAVAYRQIALRKRVIALSVAGACLLALEISARRFGRPHDRLRITAMDVGQGDAILLDTPDGRATLIDGGGFVGSPVDPGKRVILPLLRARRRARLDTIVLSHPHPDHFGGLLSVVDQMDVGEFWDTGQGEAQGAGPIYAALLAKLREKRVPILRPADLCGRPIQRGDATLSVLSPCPSFDPDLGANDNSFVIRVRYRGRTALFMGDAEAEAEEHLLTRGELSRNDFLKVGHHGSRTSSTLPFLRKVAPSVAFVSCGVRNRFGHPHPTTVAAFATNGIPLFGTDDLGELIWETDGFSANSFQGAR